MACGWSVGRWKHDLPGPAQTYQTVNLDRDMDAEFARSCAMRVGRGYTFEPLNLVYAYSFICPCARNAIRTNIRVSGGSDLVHANARARSAFLFITPIHVGAHRATGGSGNLRFWERTVAT